MSVGVPRLRQSLAKLLLTECPAIVRSVLDGERRAGSKAMRRGSLVDQLVFGGAQYEVVQARLKTGARKGELATDWRCGEAQEQKAAIEERGWIPCLEHELEAAQDLAGRIRAEMILQGLPLSGGKFELQRYVTWDTLGGVAAEGTIDAVYVDDRWANTFDLKVGESANPDHLDDQVDRMFWDMQGAAYQEACASVFKRQGRHWIIRADADSKIVGVYPLSESYLTLGAGKWGAAQRIWQQCTETNEWPQYKRRPIMPSQRAIQRAIERGYIAE